MINVNMQQINSLLILILSAISNKVGAIENLNKSDRSLYKSENFNPKIRLAVPKCCKINEVVVINIEIVDDEAKMTRNCKYFSEELDFSIIPIYNDDLIKTERSLTDVFSFEYNKFNNETFKDHIYVFPGMKQNFYLTESGILYREQPNELKRWHVYDKNNYCIDYLFRRIDDATNITVLNFFSIYIFDDVSRSDTQDYIMTSGLFISCAFLFLTFLVYLVLSELRNLGGMILMAYVFSLFNAFFFLAMLKLFRFEVEGCAAMTYTTYFFFLSSFCWMNVMSCDIWWTFRGYAKARPIHRRGEPFKFMIYSLYGFGVPMLMTIFMYVVENADMSHLPWFVTPHLRMYRCFIGDDAKLVYLYAPMLIMIVGNWMFFLMTAFNIWRLHRSTKVLDTASGAPAAHRKQKDRFLIYLKLSIIMGINWLLEVISSFQPKQKLWYISDIYNILIGLSIFLIFVCKRTTFKKLFKRFRGYSESVRGWHRSHSVSHSSQTSDSEVSTETPLVCISPNGPVVVTSYRSKDTWTDRV